MELSGRAGVVVSLLRVVVRGLLGVCLALSATSAFALPVSEAAARRVAQNLLRQHVAAHGSWGGSTTPVIEAMTPVESGGDRIALNFTISPSGHVLVGGDDELSAVLLYSDVSGFDPSRASNPESLEGWIVPEAASHMARLRNQARGRQAGSRPPGWEKTRTGQDWRWLDVSEVEFRPRSRRSAEEAATAGAPGVVQADLLSVVGPLVKSNWEQGSPYNNLLPADTGCTHTLAGCVTVAVAQLMNYWQWPGSGTGSHSYLWPGHSTLGADFAHPYQWDLMPNILNAASSADQIAAVGRLVSDVAIASEMDFGCYSSGAYSSYAVNTVLTSYFGYSKARSYNRSQYSDASQFFGLIQEDLDAAPPRPVLLSVFTTDGYDGHFLVIDGYDTSTGEMAHLNLGWGVSYQGYYNIDSDWTAGQYLWSANSQVIYTGLFPRLSVTVSSVTRTSAVASVTVQASTSPVSVVVEYGPSAAYGSTTTAQVAGPSASATTLEFPLTGLTCGSLYHARASVTDARGTLVGTDSTFASGACSVLPTVKSISAGGANTCVVTAAGGVGGAAFCWGGNVTGEVGDGTTQTRFVPTAVSGLGAGVAAVAVGISHVCAVMGGGALSCWGGGYAGDGTYGPHTTPTQVSGLTGGVLAAGAGNHICAVTSAGAVLCWGDNTWGQLGDGTTTLRAAPVTVIGLQGTAVMVAGGLSHSCALTAAGAVQCWGYNAAGQLGDGSLVARSTPAVVSGLESGVAAIAAGGYFTCALTAGGAVVCWGDNFYGQIGDGTSTGRRTPTAVGGLSSGVTAIAAGSRHACAAKTDGSIVCWGDNEYGQLGDGTTALRRSPVAVAGLTGATSTAVGSAHSCALLASGAVVCWGANPAGQLGDGTYTDRLTPVQVNGQGSWIVRPTVTQVSPSTGLTTGGLPVTLTGTGFASGATVMFGGVAAPAVVSSATAIVATTPPHASGLVGVAVANADGGQSTSTAAFLYRAPTTSADLDGSGRSSLAVFRGAAGAWWIHGQADPIAFGQAGDIPVVADYNGDGKAELAVYRPSTSEWIVQGQAPVGFGQAGDVPVPGDYDGDGRAEMAVFRPATGEWAIEGQATPTVWGMRGDIPAPADYNGDGKTDLAVFRPTTGVWWVMGGDTLAWGMWGDVPVPGDYNGDGQAEIAVYRPATGWWYVALGAWRAWGAAGDLPVPLDVDGDGRTEFVVFRPSDGMWYAVNPTTGAITTVALGAAGDVPVGQPPRLSTAVPRTAGDFDRDGSADLTVFRPSDGGWYTLQSTRAFGTWEGVTLGQAGDVLVPGDYEGAGRQERAVYRPSTGQWLLEDGRTFVLGAPGDVPVPGDYDGDGTTDLAVFTPATAQWSILTSASGLATRMTQAWGAPGDTPAPGDYDKDGLTDLAVFTPATGVWTIRGSKTGAPLMTVPFGMSGDIPVPGDYDGDGATDIAVYRPATGMWYVLTSSSGFANWTWSWWGAAEDIPVPGDYDGDGKTDIAVYRPSAGAWYVLNVVTIYGWGQAGDIPVLARRP